MKMKYVKKTLATVLAVALMAGTVNNMPVLAEDLENMPETEAILETKAASVTDSGSCGENATWTYNNGVLTISGSGEVAWEHEGENGLWTPWYDYRDAITSVIIENGITGFSDSVGNTITGKPYLYSCNEYAFAYSKMERVSLPESLVKLPLFKTCTKLKEIEIPGGITKIPENAFFQCYSLEKVVAKSVTEIGNTAFYDCQELKVLVLANAITFNGLEYGVDSYFNPFVGCYSLADENGMVIIGNILWLGNGEKFGVNVVIPEGVKTVVSLPQSYPDKSKWGLPQVKTVTIPSTLQIDSKIVVSENDDEMTVLTEWLSELTGLKKIEVSEDNPLYTSVNDCLLNKEKTEFLVCPNAMEGNCVIPKGIEKIGYGALSQCAYLTKVMIPDSVKEIEESGLCTANATSIYFSGNAVKDTGNIFYDKYYDSTEFIEDYKNMQEGDYKQTITEELEKIAQKKIYYVEGTSGWDKLKKAYPRVQWLTWDGKESEETCTVPYYNLSKDGGTWDGSHYTKKDGTIAKDVFFFDGSNTYYLQADGTPMKDRLTYHPDGKHIIYLDSNGHEVFNSFQYCPSVGYTCYFDSNGYIYKDQITFVGDKTYYLNGNGKMENEGWFQFANGRDYGFANWDGTLNIGGFSYDPWGRVVFYHWNGMVARGLITDGQWYYLMDETDGHYTGSFPVN